MKKKRTLTIDLRVFDEGGGAPAAGDGAQTGGEQQPAAEASGEAETEAPDLDKEFDELIKGKYKPAFDKRAQRIAAQKHKQAEGIRKQAEQANGLVNMLAAKYGLQDATAEDVQRALEGDESFWAESAAREGMSVDQYRHMQQLEAQNRSLIERYDREQRERVAQDQYNRWMREAEECREKFPNFDFQAELQNEEFANHLRNGVPVTKAYMYTHMDDIMTGAMATTAKKVTEKAAAAVKSNIKRPVEAAAGGGPAADIHLDFKNMSLEDFQKIQERVEAGERVTI